jgi:hypothetical protein
MSFFDVCVGCSRHVKTTESTCPFCGTARRPTAGTRPLPLRRVSRAHWLAFGSTVMLAACTESGAGDAPGAAQTDATTPATDATTPNADATTSPQDAAGDVSPPVPDAVGADIDASASRDGALDADAGAPNDGAEGASDAGPADADPYADVRFPCFYGNGTGNEVPEGYCDPKTEVCIVGTAYNMGCYAFDGSMFGQNPADCGAAYTCPCLYANLSISLCSCEPVDSGGPGALRVTCSGCYGAPPARLERFTLDYGASSPDS